jgi:dephospho-CoA kinase
MKTIGITGGIGSGKSTVCRIFGALGIPVFYADAEAAILMAGDLNLRRQVIEVLGPEAYPAGKIDRAYIAGRVFGSTHLLAALNGLVHPAVGQAWKEWVKIHEGEAPYVLKEAAILFESGTHTSVTKIIGVSAPEALRLARTQSRDGSTPEAVQQRMARQLDEAEKMSRCDFIITNDDRQALLPQVLELHCFLVSDFADS